MSVHIATDPGDDATVGTHPVTGAADQTTADPTTAAPATAPPAEPAPGPRQGRGAALVGSTLLAVGVALAAANLRPAVTSLASVLGDVRASLGATTAWTSLLTAVPTVCFGVAAFAAPWLGRRFGMARAVGASLVVLTLGLVLRVLDGPAVLLGGTFTACAGIAVCNVLIPVVVKESFPDKVGFLTGVYTAALAAGAAVGAALTPTLETVLGSWQLAAATWALLSTAALLVWSASARHGAAPAVAPAHGARPAAPARRTSVLRSPLAWVITVFFGLQSLLAYTVMGWLPQIMADSGVDRTTAGMLLAITMVLGVPVSLVVPPLATRWGSQSWLVVLLGSLSIAGILGLAIAPVAAPGLWVVLIGTGMCVFPLALVIISLRTATAADTANLSAMAQSIGYLISAAGPFAFGVLRDVTGAWTVSMYVLAGVLVALIALGVIAGRPRTL
ncbi:MFS transporter [Actinosynnema mirum]|uniref:Major facilitator superfamily MFS_1 n=1 Tax=Actinosynnema mirum (strain ATCC 29888 / DSM 43827 / JCM 3225 / NBRC 14064 / NCIMB 13271 / NRRL B-12336 / IMRU 3971 / 101) TaxID=446462 RepID=C6WER3_ACTMD|nr:MFS transporter [Actinosynnema mirum]ACU39688.1 major facilitator superfamily MFS_1 [Actinosynnema mirum DSM 43827]